MKLFILIVLAAFCGMAQAETYQLYPATCINRVCTSGQNGVPVATTPTQIDVAYFWGGGTGGIVIGDVVYTGTGGGTAQAPDGRQVQLSLAWSTTRTCTHSGRGQHCTTVYVFQAGSVTTP